MKNKFALWSDLAHGKDMDVKPENYQPPNAHMNLRFTAPGCHELMCELQIQHKEIMELGLIQHKYYEIRRAADIHALC